MFQIVIQFHDHYNAAPCTFLLHQLWKTPVKPIASKDSRPVNLDIGSMKLPITAYVSIMHRASGVVLFALSVLMIWALDQSLASEQSFIALGATLSSPIAKFLIWGTATALTYHSLAGIKHIIMDFGYGESMEGGVLGARIVITSAIIFAVIWGVIVW